MRDIDKRAIDASADGLLLETFISENERFILKCASKHSGKFITKSDDEWAVALEAFNEAISSYSYEKGSFISFARLLIERRIVDNYRKQLKYNSEISVDPHGFESETGEESQIDPVRKQMLDRLGEEDRKADRQAVVQGSIRDEIDAISVTFSRYGFSFFDLTNCSPKADKTRRACAHAVNFIAQNPVLLNEMRSSGMLPIKIIEKNLKIPRKILERHRKYIIAVLEISEGDYPYLAEYVMPFREEYGK